MAGTGRGSTKGASVEGSRMGACSEYRFGRSARLAALRPLAVIKLRRVIRRNSPRRKGSSTLPLPLLKESFNG
jgi:hypothetical protein